MKILLTAISCSLTLLAGIATAEAATVTLYDGTTLPNSQGWTYQNPQGNATQTLGSGFTTLDSTLAGQGDYAGYLRFGTGVFPLNRTIGYTIAFNVQVSSEDNSGSDKNGDGINDRAGFSIIVLSSDLQGIELGFWTNEIWAQNEGAEKPPPTGTRFTHAEGVAFNTQSSLIRYDLSVSGNSYSLFANSNYNAPILSGSLRNYSNEPSPFPPFPSPYIIPNFLFLGDNTTSASARINLGRVSATDAPISSAAAVPYEFSPTIGLLTLGAFATFSYLKKRQA